MSVPIFNRMMNIKLSENKCNIIRYGIITITTVGFSHCCGFVWIKCNKREWSKALEWRVGDKIWTEQL